MDERIPARPAPAFVPLAALSGLAALAVLSASGCATVEAGPRDLAAYARVERAHALARGEGTLVAVADWRFDLSPGAAIDYTAPVSAVPGEKVGSGEPGQGERMARIVRRIAPEARIMPIRARPEPEPGKDAGLGAYQGYLVDAIRMAADAGAVAVCNSMGPVLDTSAFREAVSYAEAKGTVFVDVHPAYVAGEDWLRFSPFQHPAVVRAGVVSTAENPVRPNPLRDVYAYPFEEDGADGAAWGYANAPPLVAGTIALVKSAAPDLSPRQVKDLLKRTARRAGGFRVLDAEAAVEEALRIAGRTKAGEAAR